MRDVLKNVGIEIGIILEPIWGRLGLQNLCLGHPDFKGARDKIFGPPFGSHFGQSGAKLGKIAAFFTKIGSLKATTARKRQYCQLPP